MRPWKQLQETVKFQNILTHAYDSFWGLACGFPGDLLASIGSQNNRGTYHRVKVCPTQSHYRQNCHQSPSKNESSTRPGIVSLRAPRQFREIQAALTSTAPEVHYRKPGSYPTIDDIMEAVVKSVIKNNKEKLLPPATKHHTDAMWRSTNI